MRPPSVSNEQIKQCKQLLGRGLPLIEIARLIGTSDRTVRRIEAGELTLRSTIGKPKKQFRPEKKRTGGYVRCQCGGRVKRPCKLCATRKWMQKYGRPT